MGNLQRTKQLINKLQALKPHLSVLKNIDLKIGLLIAIPLFVVLFIIFSIVNLIERSAQNSNAQITPANQIAKPWGVATINKDFTFSLKDANGKTVGTFAYTLQNAELDKEIVVKGSRATAIAGRIFLIINLKLNNTQDKGLQVNTRDYVRLSVNGNTKELLAPEIHNDPVEVQAISTKYTRVGFAVNETDKNFVLKAGEIDGKKEDIKLLFKKG